MLRHPEIYVNKERKTKKIATNSPVKGKVENLASEENFVNLSIRDWMLKLTKMRINKEDFNNPQNSNGCTILMYATLYADIEIVRRILDERIYNKDYTIDTKIKNKQGDTALTFAVLTGDEKKIKLLFEYDAKIESIKKKDSNDSVRVQNSLSSKSLKILILKEWMLKIVRMKRRKEDFNTPLNLSNGRIFIDKDNKGNKVININAKDKFRYTALTIAAQSDNMKKMVLLMKNDADLDLAKKKASKDVREKLDKLYQQIHRAKNDFIWAMLFKNYQKAKSLLESNLINVNARLSNYKETILMHVADLGFKEEVELMLKQPKIDVNIRDISGITALMNASAKGYDEIVKMLVNHGADVNNRDIPQRFSALICASEKGHEKVVKILLNHGADVNAQGNKGQTALMLSIYYGHMGNGYMKNSYMEVIKYLLKFGADVNIKNCEGETALMLAVAQGCEEVVNQLIKYGNSNIENKNMALMIASSQGHEKIVEMLLNYNANVKCKDIFGITSLMLAIKNGNISIINLLLKNGADINIKDYFGASPFMYAIRNGNLEIVKLLLEKGAEVNIKDCFEVTPLMRAVESGNLKLIKLLLCYQKNIDFDAVNYYGETLMDCAKKIGRKKIIKLIQSRIDQKSQQIKLSQEEIEYKEEIKSKLTKSINEKFWEAVSQGDGDKMDSLLDENDNDNQKLVNERNKSGETALIISTRKGHINVMRSLLEYNADLSLMDSKGDTALLIASDNGDLGAVKLLLENGADPPFKDANGDNALIRAVKNNRFDVVEELIYRKPIINSQGKDNKTALMIAVEKGFIRLVKLLIKKDAKINAKNSYGKTALDIIKDKINNTKGKSSNTNILETIKEILEKKEKQPRLFEDLKTKLVDTWEVVLTNNYDKNQKFWEKNGINNFEKIQDLIKEIKLDPFRGRGHPKPLKGNLKGLYSRRIDKENRLVYEIDGEKVILKSCLGHYKQEKRNC